MCKIEVPGLVG